MDPFTAILAAAASGGVSGLMSGFGKGDSGSTGYDIVNFNDPQDEVSRAMSAAYMQDVLSALRAGKTPDWLNQFAADQESYLLKQNRDQMFGREGMSGGSIMDAAMSAGAQTGVGGYAAQAPANKALADYADRMSGINQYITSLKANYMTNASTAAPQSLYTMAQPRNQVVGGMGSPATGQNPIFSGIGESLGKIDWSAMVKPQTQAPSQYAFMPQQQQVVPQKNFGLPSGNALSGLFPLTGGY